MLPFTIKSLPQGTPYSFGVIATTYRNPFDELSQVESVLQVRSSGKPGVILFDLLCAVGRSSNRFVTAYFDGTAIINTSTQIVSVDDANILARLDAFYAEHPTIFEASVLTPTDTALGSTPALIALLFDNHAVPEDSSAETLKQFYRLSNLILIDQLYDPIESRYTTFDASEQVYMKEFDYAEIAEQYFALLIAQVYHGDPPSATLIQSQQLLRDTYLRPIEASYARHGFEYLLRRSELSTLQKDLIRQWQLLESVGMSD